MPIYPVTGTSDSASVTVAAAALGGSMAAGEIYQLVSSTNCWVKQGTTKLVTCVTKANAADSDYITIAITNVSTVIYEFDKTGDGVTAGRIRVDISGATTAASVAVILRVAILANQSVLTVTDNLDGTLTITAPDRQMTIVETVANAGFLVAAAIVPVTAADGSLYLPLGVIMYVNGDHGLQIGILRSTADGSASLTRCKVY